MRTCKLLLRMRSVGCRGRRRHHRGLVPVPRIVNPDSDTRSTNEGRGTHKANCHVTVSFLTSSETAILLQTGLGDSESLRAWKGVNTGRERAVVLTCRCRAVCFVLSESLATLNAWRILVLKKPIHWGCVSSVPSLVAWCVHSSCVYV